MIQPLLADDALLADIHQARQQPDRFHLWWLGQSGFLLHWQGQFLLLDPYLSDSLTRKYAQTDKPHVRMTARCIDPARLDFVSVVTSSHNHTDHLDAETLLAILLAGRAVQLVVPQANRQFAADRLGIDPARLIGLDDGLSADCGPFRLTGIPAAHDALEQDEHGHHRFLGYVVQFGGQAIYHSGDTRPWPGLAGRVRPYRPAVALLPINGHDPARRVAGNLSGPEAAELACAIGAGVAIPCHYEMFTFNTASPDAFVARAGELGQPACVLRCGQRWTSGHLN